MLTLPSAPASGKSAGPEPTGPATPLPCHAEPANSLSSPSVNTHPLWKATLNDRTPLPLDSSTPPLPRPSGLSLRQDPPPRELQPHSQTSGGTPSPSSASVIGAVSGPCARLSEQENPLEGWRAHSLPEPTSASASGGLEEGGGGVSPQENPYLSQLPGGDRGCRPGNLTLRTAKTLARLSLPSLHCGLHARAPQPEGPSRPRLPRDPSTVRKASADCWSCLPKTDGPKACRHPICLHLQTLPTSQRLHTANTV